MKKHPSTSLPLLFLITGFLSLITTSLSARTWTATGGHIAEGELVEFDGTTVTLLLTNGKNAQLPLSRLSEADQEFVKENHQVEKPLDKPTSSEDIFNWDDPWPDQAVIKDVEVIVESEDAENKKFIYASNHFRFTCDVRLTSSVVSTFAKMFEASHRYCDIIPLSFKHQRKSTEKFDVRLFEEKADYIKAGGPPSSAGVFLRRGKKSWIMIPLISLGVQKFGSGYRRDRDKSDSTLVHEIVHQLSPPAYFARGARGWFSEGFADYISQTPYRSGRFKVTNNFDYLTEYFSAFGKDGRRGRNLGKEISAPALQDFMSMSYQKFLSNSNFNYGFGLCITTYFIHLEGEGDASLLKTFLAKLHEKQRIQSDEELQELLEILLNGRTWEELQEDVQKKWRRKGIKITFRPPSSNEQ